jgi:hypothetical protein
MWTRKAPEEMASEKRTNLMRNLCGVLLLWVVVWYALASFRPLFGQPLRDSTMALMGIALIVAILLVWRLVWQTRQRRQNTMVCDRCNAVKSADGQQNCKCGGQYLTLLEMKWITQVPEKQPRPTKTADRMLAHNMP